MSSKTFQKKISTNRLTNNDNHQGVMTTDEVVGGGVEVGFRVLSPESSVVDIALQHYY